MYVIDGVSIEMQADFVSHSGISSRIHCQDVVIVSAAHAGMCGDRR